MNKRLFFLLTLSLAVLPACLRVPKIKSIHDRPIILETDTEQQNGPIVFNAKRLTYEETKDFIGFVPFQNSCGIPWFVTFTNTGTKYFYLNDKSWNVTVTDPEAIITKFSNAYYYNGTYLIGASIGSLCFWYSFFWLSFAIGALGVTANPILANCMHIPIAFAATGFISTPIAAGIIYKNNRAQLPLSILTLEENLLPINSILYPDGTVQGIVFLPKKTKKEMWQVTVFDAEDKEYVFKVNTFEHEKINDLFENETE